MIELKLKDDSRLDGMNLQDLRKKIQTKFLYAPYSAVMRYIYRTVTLN